MISAEVVRERCGHDDVTQLVGAALRFVAADAERGGRELTQP